MKTHYFLFGDEASAIMGSTGNINDAVRVGCSTYKYIEGDYPVDLLAVYSGWHDFYVLTEEQYNQINKLIKER